VKILSNILELDLSNYQLFRIVGYKLDEIKELGFCEKIFRKVLEFAPKEPQSYRDLALVLEKLGKYNESIPLMYQVVLRIWDSKFSEIGIFFY
jgi:Ca-activated chloride channel family protein